MRAILDRYWEATVALDLDRVDEFYHDDAIVEFLQSGERIRGRHNYTNSGHITPLKLLADPSVDQTFVHSFLLGD